MLKKIEIENYRAYKNTFVFDLSQTKSYGFNKELIKNNIVNNALIFGYNGTGKSTLLLAIMELSNVLTDLKKDIVPDSIYFYAGTNNRIAKFRFFLQFDEQEIRFEFGKTAWDKISYEKLFVDDIQILEYSHADPSHNFCSLKDCEHLAKLPLGDQQSFVKFLKMNSIQDIYSPISKIINFANGMLYFKSLINGNQYLGFTHGIDLIEQRIVLSNKIEDFKNYLAKFDLHYDLIQLPEANGQMTLGAIFDGKVVPFGAIASSGTKALMLAYYWSLNFNKTSMILIDEFDAYYHFEAAKTLFEILKKTTNAQVILTTHNTCLLNTKDSRPDCIFIHDGTSIKPMYQKSDREFRIGDNIEAMFRKGDFSVNKHKTKK